MKNFKIKLTLLLMVLLSVSLITTLATAHGKVAKPVEKRGQWYISTTISVDDAVNNATYKGSNPVVIGKLRASKKGRDLHDIKPFSSLANNKAALVVVQDNWGEDSGEYLSSYHHTRKRNDDWVFTVVSTVPYGEVTLSWGAVHELTPQRSKRTVTYKEKRNPHSEILKRLHLVDLKTGQVTDALTVDGRLNTYTYVQGSDELQRNLRWVLGPIRPKHYADNPNKLDFVKSARQTVSSKGKATRLTSRPSGDKFGLPPQ